MYLFLEQWTFMEYLFLENPKYVTKLQYPIHVFIISS